MGPFSSSYSFLHILVCVDYVTKWVEAIPCVANDAKTVVNFLQKNIFTRFGTPRVLISDGGKHFCNNFLENVLKKYNIRHKVSTPYHPKTSGQVEVSNRQLKQILEKTVASNRKDWSKKLDDALWAVQRNFRLGQMVLLFNSRLRLFPDKLKSKWSRPFKVKDVKLYGAVELEDPSTKACWTVNGQRLKPYFGGEVDWLTSTISLNNPSC